MNSSMWCDDARHPPDPKCGHASELLVFCTRECHALEYSVRAESGCAIERLLCGGRDESLVESTHAAFAGYDRYCMEETSETGSA